jgi:hypothetical protein
VLPVFVNDPLKADRLDSFDSNTQEEFSVGSYAIRGVIKSDSVIEGLAEKLGVYDRGKERYTFYRYN